MPEPSVRNTPAEKHDRIITMMIMCAVAIIALLVFVVIKRLHDKKWHRQFDEKYLKVLQMDKLTHGPECEHK